MRHLNSRWTAALAALLLLTVGSCGGGGGDPFSGGTTTFFASDLTLFSDGSTSPGLTGLNVGDTATNLEVRLGVRFVTLSALNAGDPIESATLRLRQTAVTGAACSVLGSVVVDRSSWIGPTSVLPFFRATSLRRSSPRTWACARATRVSASRTWT